MGDMSLAWVNAQIEREKQRGNNPDAVRDLAALLAVRDHLAGCAVDWQSMADRAGKALDRMSEPTMRDANTISIRDYQDNRGNAKPVSHQTRHDGEPLNKAIVTEWVDAMWDEDGIKGEKYTWHQTQQYALNMGITGEQRKLEFYWAMNAMYSDYHAAGKKFGVDVPEFYACLAKLFIEDADAVENKVQEYVKHVVKH